ncbi:MAG: GGDEF domain-containing protein [Planctomycetota bacterium]|nr:GGDEF domain-containing protein [Planctomycetota bacterium]
MSSNAKASTTDASAHGLLRLYFRILSSAAGAVFVLHGVIGLVTGFGDQYGPVLIGMDAFLLLLAVLGHELAAHAQAMERNPPKGLLLFVTGIYLVFLAAETGGLASPFFMLVLVTCVFSALLLSGLAATLITAMLAALHAAAAWLLPTGLLRVGLEGIEASIKGGRSMPIDEVTGLAMHSAFLFLGAYIAHRLSSDFRSKVVTLEDHATRDPLTQLPNRRGFMQKMREEIARAERFAWPMSILVIDLDHFKMINDEHGHAFGDAVLAQSAQILRDSVGPVDHLARVGGEEFAVAAVAADPQHGAELASRIVRRFRQHPWAEMKPGLKVTCSVGVAGLDTARSDASLSRMLEEADKALYQVKESGRNNYALAESSPGTRETEASRIAG